MSATNKRTGSIQLQDLSPLIRRIEWFSGGLLAFRSSALCRGCWAKKGHGE